MADLPALTLADQALANVLGAIAMMTVTDEPRLELLLSLLPDLLPAASATHPHIAPLIREGLGIMALGPRRHQAGDSGTVEWSFARLSLCAAVHGFTYWRAGMAWDALQSQAKGTAA